MQHLLELKRMLKIMEGNKADLENELRYLPTGDLKIMKKGDSRYFFQHFPKKGNRKKSKSIAITKNTEMIMGLVRKRYILKALQTIDHDIRVLDTAIKHYKPFDEESLMKDYVTRHPGLEVGLYHGMQSDEEWADDYRRQLDYHRENLIHISPKGVLMRSKNELYISTRLDHYGIPYRYESSLSHPDVADRLPDFTIRRPRDGKIIYWEHVGMTNVAGYMHRNDVKWVDYENVGIVPWDNLILTYDRPDGGVDAKIIEAMIQGWLL